jgi:TolB-like protein/Tfp pilus assembly protein PilF
MRVFDELKQRKVLQTAALYFAIAWGATEVLSFLVERIPVFPAWTETAIAILFILGFPVAVFLAWMFDVGKDGVRRADPASGIGKGVIMVSMVGLLGLTGLLSYLLVPRIEAERGFVHEGDPGTVAVLPFDNLTGDPSLGYLGVGLAEDIRQRLASQTDIKVVGRVSLAGFAGTGVDLASVRNLLDAGLALEGNLQNIAGQMQVSLALLDTATGRQIWANTFSAEETGWGPLRQRIVESIAEALSLTVEAREEDHAQVPDEALQAYLRALSHLHQPGVADGFFDEAIWLAPEFADAYARKALLRFDMIWLGLQSHVAWEQGETLIAKAKEIDPENIMADIALGHLQWWALGDSAAAAETFRQAEQRSPNDPLVLAGLGTALRYIPFKEEEALAYHRRYLALDPLNPDAHLRIAKTLAFAHRMDEAMAHLGRALEINPGFTRSLDYIANVEGHDGQVADALTTLTRKGRIEGVPSDETLSCMGDYAAFALPPDQAIAYLERIIARKTGPNDDILSWCWEPDMLRAMVFAWTADQPEKALSIASELDPEAKYAALAQYFVEDIVAVRQGDHQKRYDLLMELMGPDMLDQYPTVTHENIGGLVSMVRILMQTGRTEDALALGDYVLPYIRQSVGSTAHFGLNSLVDLLAVLGQRDEAIALIEHHGFGRIHLATYYEASQGLWAPELKDEPIYAALVDALAAKRAEETAEIDRRVASGEIVLP